jgi:membrane-bound lytic murein transglycosylase D
MAKTINFHLFLCSIAILCSVLSSCSSKAQEITNDSLLSALKPEQPIQLCGEPVPLNIPQVKERFEKEMLVSLENRAQVILWLKRTTRYFPYIEKMLKDNGLPDDIKYLAVAESDLRMHAGSSKGAMGFWQLMPQTARKYGLTVDDNFDERRNLYLSTPAAVTYLKTLYERFHSWNLALAAYNMGEEGLDAEILEQGIADYYNLYLPLETQRFLLRIMAIKRIVEAPESHGFTLSQDDFYPPDSFSTVQVSVFNEVPVRLIANAAKTDFKTIKDLNPEIRGYYLAPGTRAINIPNNGTTGFQDRLAGLIETDTRIRSQRIYVVKEGESLSGIAEKFAVPLAALLIWNQIDLNNAIHPGQRLVIFPSAEEGETGPENN